MFPAFSKSGPDFDLTGMGLIFLNKFFSSSGFAVRFTNNHIMGLNTVYPMCPSRTSTDISGYRRDDIKDALKKLEYIIKPLV